MSFIRSYIKTASYILKDLAIQPFSTGFTGPGRVLRFLAFAFLFNPQVKVEAFRFKVLVTLSITFMKSHLNCFLQIVNRLGVVLFSLLL